MLDSVSIDLASQTANLSSNLKGSVMHETASGIAEVSVRVGTVDDAAAVCESGIDQGSYSVTYGSGSSPSSVDPPTGTVSRAAMGLLYGSSTPIACVSIVSDTDATVGVETDSAAVELTDCNEEPADIDGYWTGTYTCTNSCYPSDDDLVREITLHIDQNGSSATYTDSEAKYQGSICGNVFKYESISAPGYTEYGTFTLNADGSAGKTSTWTDTAGLCHGDCQDSLSLYVVPE